MKLTRTFAQNRPLRVVFAWAVSLVAMLALVGCSASETILPGERKTVFEAYQLPVLDSGATEEGADIGAPVNNTIFAQAGTNPAHKGGHLAFEWPAERLWSTRIGIAADFATQMGQAVASGGRIYAVTPDAIISAVDAETGTIIWQQPVEQRNDTTQPGVSGNAALDTSGLFAHAGGRTLIALDPDSGKTLWRQDFPVPLAGGPTVAAGRIAVTDIDGRLYVLATRDGNILWNRVGSLEETGVLGAPAPAIYRSDLVYAGDDGEITALALDSGEFLWGDNLATIAPRTALEGINAIVAHPVHDGGLVFVATMSGRMVALNHNSGQLIWEQPVAANQMPWLAGQTVYVVSNRGRVFALRRQDGAIRWIAELPGAIPLDRAVSETPIHYVGPLVVAGRLLVISQGGALYTLDAGTGDLIAERDLGESVSVSPIVIDGKLIIFDDSGRLTAYR